MFFVSELYLLPVTKTFLRNFKKELAESMEAYEKSWVDKKNAAGHSAGEYTMSIKEASEINDHIHSRLIATALKRDWNGCDGFCKSK